MDLNIIYRYFSDNWILILVVFLIIVLTVIIRMRMDDNLTLLPSKLSIFPDAKLARYVRLERNPAINQPLILNINEIQVFDNKNKLIENNVRPSLAPQYGNPNQFGSEFLVDNVLTSRVNNQWRLPHTQNNNNSFMELDLGSSHWISRVRIVNRNDCCQDRITKARLVLLDRNRKELCNIPITKIQNEYQFNFNRNSCILSPS